MKTVRIVGSIVVMINALFDAGVEAQLPANFSVFTLTTDNSNVVAPDSIFSVGHKSPRQALTEFSDFG